MIHLEFKRKHILFLIAVVGLLGSCNLFVSPPLIRENTNDDRMQITGFTAVPSSDTSITTMWNWRPPDTSMEPDEKIDEIKIIHSTLGYPEFTIPFVGETFTDRTKWQFEWKDLTPDTIHYFSLFVKDTNGRWYASYKVKVSLPGVVKETAISLDNAWKVGSTPSISTGITIESANNAGVIVLEFDKPKNMKVLSAVINPDAAKGLKTVSLDSFKIYPLIRKFNVGNSQTAWDETGVALPVEGELVDKQSGVSLDGTNNSFNTIPLDITVPVQKALVTGSNQLVIHTNPNIIFYFPYSDFIILTYAE